MAHLFQRASMYIVRGNNLQTTSTRIVPNFKNFENACGWCVCVRVYSYLLIPGVDDGFLRKCSLSEVILKKGLLNYRR